VNDADSSALRRSARPDGGYFAILGLDGEGVGGAGEITNVTQVFQPSGRFFAANSP
jgi:hypothetical protein